MNGRMRTRVVPALAVVLGVVVMVSSALAKDEAFTGVVGDAMCGLKHMEGDDASCTRACVSHGSQYALIVGDKVYKLDTSDKAALATLDKQAGAKVTVKGALKGDTIAVSGVAAAH